MKGGHTFVGDLKSAATQLDEDAQTHKNSYYNLRWGWEAERQAEYDELRRLAKRMREIARVETRKENQRLILTRQA